MKWREFWMNIATNIIAGIVVAILVVMGSSLIVAWATISDHIATKTGVVLLALGWISTVIISAIFFLAYRNRKISRTLATVRAMYLPDRILRDQLDGGIYKLNDKELNIVISQILNDLCANLASQYNFNDKAASFMILENNEPDAHFKVFAHIHHPERMPSEVSKLTRNKGFAAQALREGVCKVIYDCEDCPRDIEWVPTYPTSRFRGRTAAPVQLGGNGQTRDIGVLCFDTKKPHILSRENQELLIIAADKIAILWDIYH